MKNWITGQEADRVTEVCMYVIKTGGRAWQKSKAQQKMCQRTQNVSPLTCNWQSRILSSCKFVFINFTRLSGITACSSHCMTFSFLLHTSFLPSSVQYCPTVPAWLWTVRYVCTHLGVCWLPAKQVTALFYYHLSLSGGDTEVSYSLPFLNKTGSNLVSLPTSVKFGKGDMKSLYWDQKVLGERNGLRMPNSVITHTLFP